MKWWWKKTPDLLVKDPNVWWVNTGKALASALLPNEVGSGSVIATGGATNNVDGSAVINAAFETGTVSLKIPSQWTKVGHIIVMLTNNPPATGTFNFSVTVQAMREGETFVAINRPDFHTMIEPLPRLHKMTYVPSDFVTLNLLPGDLVAISLSHEGAGGGHLATDCIYYGAFVTES